jgi:molybdopterin converting factor small subunit
MTTHPPGATTDGTESSEVDASDSETTLEVRCTGHVRTEVGSGKLEYTFVGTTLREFLDAFFDDYDVAELVMAQNEAEESTSGWAPMPEELPGTWRANPKGDRTRAYARVTVNGTFNEHLDGLDTALSDGDRVALIYPFMFCL